MRGLLLLWTRSSRSPHFKKKGQSGGTESPERGSVSTIKTDRLHDLRLLSSYWRSWYSSWLLLICSVSVFRNDDVQECDSRWDEIIISMTKIPPDDILDSLCKLGIRGSDQLKTILELNDIEIHQKISMPNHQKLKTMAKRSIDQKLRLRNFDVRHWKIETGAVVKSWKGSKWYWKRTRSFLSVERKRPAFERRAVQFPPWQWWACKIKTKKRSILWATITKRSKCVEKRNPQISESVWEVQSTAVQRLLQRYLH